MKTNQKGIAVVAVILLVVLVGLVGATGWYVYNSNKNTNKSLDNTQSAANSTTENTKKDAAATKPTATPTATATPTPQSTQKYLIIKEWGVKVPLSDIVADAYYVIKDGGNMAWLSTRSISAKYPMCSPDNTSILAYGRFTDKNQQLLGTTYGQAFPSAVLVNGQYYYSQNPQSGCVDSGDVVKIQNDVIVPARNALMDAINKVISI